MLASDSEKQDYRWLILIPVLLLAVWLATYGLADDSLWYDEWLAVFRAGSPQYGGPLSPAEVWSRVTDVGNFQTPAYYMLLAAWSSVAGFSEFSGRVLSLFLGLLTIAVTYRIGRIMDSLQTGLIAAIFLSVSAFYIHFFHEMRTYTLYGFFASLSVLAYWVLLTHHSQKVKIWSVLFVTGMLGMLYSHYFSILLVLGIGLYHLFLTPKNHRWWLIFSLLIFIGVMYLPWAGNAFIAAARADVTSDLYEAGAGLEANLQALIFALSNGSIAFVLLIGALALPLKIFNDSNQRSRIFLWFLALVMVVGAIIFDVSFNVFRQIRYVFPLWIIVALLLSFGTRSLARHRIPAVLVVSIWMLIGVTNGLNRDYFYDLPFTFVKLPFRDIADVVRKEGEADDIVLMHIPDFDWLRKPTFEHYMDSVAVESSLLESIEGLPGDEYLGAIASTIAGHEHVWLGVDKTLLSTFRLDETQQILSQEGYQHCETALDLPDLTLDLYAKLTDRVDYAFDQNMQLTLLRNKPDLEENQIKLLFGWRIGDDVPEDTYSVAVHLMDSAGGLVAQTDFGLPTNGLTCVSTSIPLGMIPKGNYRVNLAVYNWQTGQRLTITSTQDLAASDHPLLYTISRDVSS